MRLYSWGANTTGQLGHEFSSEQVSLPTVINTLDLHVQHTDHRNSLPLISGGGSHTVVLDRAGPGAYVFHHLGLISTKLECPKEQVLPKVTSKRQHSDCDVHESLVSGWDFSLFLDSAGTLYSIGDNTYCQLGRNTSESSVAKFSPSWNKIPIESIVQIAAGMRHAAAITGDSNLISWGDNSKGQTGLNLDFKLIAEPTQNDNGSFKPIKVRCGKSSTIVLGQDGCFYGCGWNKFGMLGDQSAQVKFGNLVANFIKLFQIEDHSRNIVVRDFQCGWNHVLVLLQNGLVMSWGRNNFCQLGRPCSNPSLDYDAVPGFVQGIPERILFIACGSEHNLVIGESGSVYSWGWNEHDNCGIPGNNVAVIERPTIVPLSTSTRAVTIACGGGTSFALTEPKI